MYEDSHLGKVVDYDVPYNPKLLYPMPRLAKRQEIGVKDAWPFYGEDLWTAYEVSWLMPGGKPQVGILEWRIPADSPKLVESKSIKLYLNAFNQTVFESSEKVQATIAQDLSFAAEKSIEVTLFSLREYLQQRPLTAFEGICLDEETLALDIYSPDPHFLKTSVEDVSETLYSDLLKSNCLVTRQPDWGSIQIHYTGPKINRAALLRYLVGFRLHNEFHEQCVERIFMDILRQCKPQELVVYARYTRRGGLDINPIRSTHPVRAPLIRLLRQ